MFKLQAQSSRVLSAALSTVAKCMQKKNALQILDNILLRKDGERMLFTASTSEAQLTIAAPLTVCGGKMDKSVCVPAADVISYISALPDCVVTLTFNDNKTLDIDYCLVKGEQTKAGQAKVTYVDADDFPLLDGCTDPVSHLVISGAYLSQVVKQTSSFAANDDLRPQMNGMFIDIMSDSTCNFVASDGNKLIRCSHNEQGDMVQPSGVIVSSIFFPAISAFAESEKITIDANAKTIHIYDEDTDLLCRTVEGRYPNYNSVIPTSSPYYVVFDKKEMLDSIKRVRLFGSHATQLVKLEKDGAFIELSSQDIDHATESCEQVCIETADCIDGFAIGFNADFFFTALAAITEDSVRIQLSDATRAAVVTANIAAPTTLVVLMPLQLN